MPKKKYIAPTGKFTGLRGAPETEFSEFFVQGMANRMGVSFHKYGPVVEAYPKKLDAIETLEMKIDLYVNGGIVKGVKIEPGNTEYLMDAANYCMIEFMLPKHKNAHFKATDSKSSNGRVWRDGKVNSQAHGEMQEQDATAEFYRGRGGE